jgi:hypothetical protein
MADVLFVIIHRQFGSRRLFFSIQKLPKNKGYILTIKIGIVSKCPTGVHKPVRPVEVTLPKYNFNFTIA